MFDMESAAEDEGLRFEAAEDTEGQPKEEEGIPKLGIIVAGVTFICSEVLPLTWADLECRRQTLQGLRRLQLCVSGLGGL